LQLSASTDTSLHQWLTVICCFGAHAGTHQYCHWGGGSMSSFTLYLVGVVIAIAGLGYAAYLAHVPDHWLAAGVIIAIGIGIVGAVRSTRFRDPP